MPSTEPDEQAGPPGARSGRGRRAISWGSRWRLQRPAFRGRRGSDGEVAPLDQRAVDRVVGELGGASHLADHRSELLSLVNTYEVAPADERVRIARALASTFGADGTGPLVHEVSQLEPGVRFLVDLRADCRTAGVEWPDLVPFGEALGGHLRVLFSFALLEVRQLTWDSPASVLEQLIVNEAVHEITSWDDLKHRLRPDRRCFGLFHRVMPDSVLAFTQIALTDGIPSSLPPLLDPVAPVQRIRDADTAVFYSISNCEPGLAGINVGAALIKDALRRLQAELPGVKRFVTLSPMPGFRRWLLSDGPAAVGTEVPADLLAGLSTNAWLADADLARAARPVLLRAAAAYLTQPVDGRATDPVANFHLSNGASVEAIHWLANPAVYELDRSFGMMVSYRYDPAPPRGEGHRYRDEGVVPRSKSVQKLLDAVPRAKDSS